MSYNIGPFGFNIGTDLMLESVMSSTGNRIDDSRVIPNTIDLKKYKKWYINLNSFLSNVLSSYDKDTVAKVLAGDLKTLEIVKDRALDEMVLLDSITIDKIEVIFFYVDYSRYKPMLSPIDTKTKVGSIHNLLLKLMNLVIDDSLYIDNIRILNKVNRISYDGISLVTTSIPMDLLHSKTIDLLEFHTGVLKKRNKFYTKIKTNEPIPFEEILLLSLGDKKGMIKSPLSTKEKKILMDSILNKRIKPHMVYPKSTIIGMVSDKEISKKMKSIPTIY